MKQGQILNDIKRLDQSAEELTQDFIGAVVNIHVELSALVAGGGRSDFKAFWESFQHFRVRRLDSLWSSLKVTPFVSHEATQLWTVDMLRTKRRHLEQSTTEGTVNSAMRIATIQLSTEESKAVFYASGFVVQKIMY